MGVESKNKELMVRTNPGVKFWFAIIEIAIEPEKCVYNCYINVLIV